MREALEPLPGVTDVEVEVEAKQAVLTVDPERFDAQQAIDALAKEGFEKARVVEEEDEAPGADEAPEAE